MTNDKFKKAMLLIIMLSCSGCAALKTLSSITGGGSSNSKDIKVTASAAAHNNNQTNGISNQKDNSSKGDHNKVANEQTNNTITGDGVTIYNHEVSSTVLWVIAGLALWGILAVPLMGWLLYMVVKNKYSLPPKTWIDEQNERLKALSC
jgi:hypothetical protein